MSIVKLPSFFKFGVNREHTVAVCDIGSGSVAIGIVEVRGKEKPVALVLVSERRALAQEERDTDRLIEQLKILTKEVCSSVLDRHAKAGRKPPSEVVAIIHAPWVHSETTNAERKFDEPTHITAAIISAVAQEASKQQTALVQASIFERSVTRITLNGYHTTSPEGKRALRVGVSVLQSDMDDGFTRALRVTLEEIFVGRSISFYSSFFATSVAIQKYADNPQHYMFIDVTSMATSASVVRGGSLLQYASAPVGWRAVVQGLASVHHTTPEEALSKMRMMGEESCNDTACQDILDALKKVEPVFVDAYGKMLAELVKEQRVPSSLILMAPPDVGGWFAALFARIDFAQFTTPERPFMVQQIFAHHLSKEVSFATGTEPDTGIATGAVFMHIRLQDASV